MLFIQWHNFNRISICQIQNHWLWSNYMKNIPWNVSFGLLVCVCDGLHHTMESYMSLIWCFNNGLIVFNIIYIYFSLIFTPCITIYYY